MSITASAALPTAKCPPVEEWPEGMLNFLLLMRLNEGIPDHVRPYPDQCARWVLRGCGAGHTLFGNVIPYAATADDVYRWLEMAFRNWLALGKPKARTSTIADFAVWDAVPNTGAGE